MIHGIVSFNAKSVESVAIIPTKLNRDDPFFFGGSTIDGSNASNHTAHAELLCCNVLKNGSIIYFFIFRRYRSPRWMLVHHLVAAAAVVVLTCDTDLAPMPSNAPFWIELFR